MVAAGLWAWLEFFEQGCQKSLCRAAYRRKKARREAGIKVQGKLEINLV
jgi:hypothetical protein